MLLMGRDLALSYYPLHKYRVCDETTPPARYPFNKYDERERGGGARRDVRAPRDFARNRVSMNTPSPSCCGENRRGSTGIFIPTGLDCAAVRVGWGLTYIAAHTPRKRRLPYSESARSSHVAPRVRSLNFKVAAIAFRHTSHAVSPPCASCQHPPLLLLVDESK